MSIVFLTPLPPTRTGVAHYASMLIPALRRHVDLTVATSNDQLPATNDERIYHLGNNAHHAWIYEEAMRMPGVVVLHDVILHHLIVEMTLARGDVEGYVDALRANHGEAGAAWARGRGGGGGGGAAQRDGQLSDAGIDAGGEPLARRHRA